MYIYIFGLPRSGTTALSATLSKHYHLELLNEPIHLWTDYFSINVADIDINSSIVLRNLRKVQVSHPRGFVEKTPSSIFGSSIIPALLDQPNVFVIYIERKQQEIVNSIVQKSIFKMDNNAHLPLWLHNLNVRLGKIWMMLKCDFFKGVKAISAYPRWVNIGNNSILKIGSHEAADAYYLTALPHLEYVRCLSHPRLIKVDYDEFRRNNLLPELVSLF